MGINIDCKIWGDVRDEKWVTTTDNKFARERERGGKRHLDGFLPPPPPYPGFLLTMSIKRDSIQRW